MNQDENQGGAAAVPSRMTSGFVGRRRSLQIAFPGNPIPFHSFTLGAADALPLESVSRVAREINVTDTGFCNEKEASTTSPPPLPWTDLRCTSLFRGILVYTLVFLSRLAKLERRPLRGC